MKTLISTLVVVGVLGLCSTTTAVHATDRYNLQSGSNCDNSDGALASGLKKTKTGLLNASTGTRYVTCEFPVSSTSSDTFQFDYFSTGFAGPDGAKVTCALHVGDSDTGYGSNAQSITLPNSGDKYMRFGSGYPAAVAERTEFSNWAVLTCILPAGVELQGSFLGIADPV